MIQYVWLIMIWLIHVTTRKSTAKKLIRNIFAWLRLFHRKSRDSKLKNDMLEEITLYNY